MILTRLLEENLFDVGVVEVLMPVVPLSPREPEVATGHSEVGHGPVTGVCAD